MFLDHEELFARLQKKFIARLEILAERIILECDPEILLLENGYSTGGIISPAMYERWDVPVIQAVARVIHRHGKILHLHQHGQCARLLDLIASTNADLVEPFERPPSGDTPDLGIIKKKYGKQFAIRGNIHSHETLLRGTAADVELEVRQCLEAAAPGGGFILASGDGVIVGTPHENLYAMVAAGEKYGKY
jgi:uroporphyrinogen decarboxylase